MTTADDAVRRAIEERVDTVDVVPPPFDEILARANGRPPTPPTAGALGLAAGALPSGTIGALVATGVVGAASSTRSTAPGQGSAMVRRSALRANLSVIVTLSVIGVVAVIVLIAWVLAASVGGDDHNGAGSESTVVTTDGNDDVGCVGDERAECGSSTTSTTSTTSTSTSTSTSTTSTSTSTSATSTTSTTSTVPVSATQVTVQLADAPPAVIDVPISSFGADASTFSPEPPITLTDVSPAVVTMSTSDALRPLGVRLTFRSQDLRDPITVFFEWNPELDSIRWDLVPEAAELPELVDVDVAVVSGGFAVDPVYSIACNELESVCYST